MSSEKSGASTASGPSSDAAPSRLAQPIPLNGTSPVGDWAWAQARANFAIVGPAPGSGWKLMEPSLRGESPTAHSTVRYFLEDVQGRRLRVKQYSNDWWIPTVSDVSFRSPGHAILAGDQVQFVGRDYRRHDASCGHRLGTAVEFSVESGALKDHEWSALWGELGPLDPTVVAEARRTSFAQRSYWNRWRRTHAPWDTSEISSLRWSDPTTEAMERSAWALTADRWASVPGAVDSIGFRAGPLGEEVQMVFRWPGHDLNVSAWLRALRAPPEPWKPLIDASEVNRPSWDDAKVAGARVRRAAMDPAVGNWFYQWRDGEKAYELHMRARKGFDVQRSEQLVANLLS